MQTMEECLLMYRRTLRQLLYECGVPSNPAVDDQWILDRIAERLNKTPEPVTLEDGKEALRCLAEKNNMSEAEFRRWLDKISDKIIREMNKDESTDGPHPSHVTRISDASTFDEICVNCGATDEVPGGWGQLAKPCPNPQGRK